MTQLRSGLAYEPRRWSGNLIWGRLTKRGLRPVGLFALAAGLAASLAIPSSAALKAAERHVVGHGAAACTTGQLVVWLDTAGSGAAGSVYYHVEFTNAGSHACVLYGYPGVSAVNLAGRQLGAPATRSVTSAPKSIALVVNGTATAILQITDTGVYAPGTCHPVEAAGIRVFPPSQKAAKVVPYPFMTCGLAGRVTLHIGALSTGVLPK